MSNRSQANIWTNNDHVRWCHMAALGHNELRQRSSEIQPHYNDVIMGTMASQITSLTIVYSTFHSRADQNKHQSSASLAFVRGIHRWPVNSPHKGPVTRKIFPFDDVIMHFACYGFQRVHNYELTTWKSYHQLWRPDLKKLLRLNYRSISRRPSC